jgi:putative addiction module antidote
MLMQKLRQVGNSFVVTIPKEEIERLNLHENDLVGIEVRKLRVTPEMTPEVAEAVAFALERYAADLDYLADK